MKPLKKNGKKKRKRMLVENTRKEHKGWINFITHVAFLGWLAVQL